jgi:hypothetical protein
MEETGENLYDLERKEESCKGKSRKGETGGSQNKGTEETESKRKKWKREEKMINEKRRWRETGGKEERGANQTVVMK